MIELSPAALSIYGFNRIEKDSLLHYGFAVIKIYGLNHTISEEEYQLFDMYFSEMLFIPRRVNDRYRAFDYQHADFDSILKNVLIPIDADIRHMAVYDAVRWKKISQDHLGLQRHIDFEHVSQTLLVPLEICLAIQGLVHAEFAITEMRKAIFRVNYAKAPEKVPTKKNALKHNSWVTLNFGHTYTTYESLLHYCQMLVYLGAGDAEINEAEMATVEAITTAAGTPRSIVATLRQFNYKKATLETLLPKFVTDTYQDLDIISVYLTIKIARSSGQYGEEEKEKVQLAATKLRVSRTDVQLLENLVALEVENESMRRKLFELPTSF